MRIVGGKYKGRIFSPGKKFKARPTTDIAKEGLFNILENRYDFSNKTVLDLFSVFSEFPLNCDGCCFSNF